MAYGKEPIGGLVEKNIPAQLDEEVLKAELEIEMPGSQEILVAPMEDEIPEDIEIIEDSEGAVIIDFHPNAKIVMITSHGEQDKVIKAIQSGASNYLLKPLDANKFDEVIKKVLFFKWLGKLF